jgi:hypothetical protein
LQERTQGDVLSWLVDRDPGLHAPDVGPAEPQLVERDVTGSRYGNPRNGGSYLGFSATGARRLSLGSDPSPRNQSSL